MAIFRKIGNPAGDMKFIDWLAGAGKGHGEVCELFDEKLEREERVIDVRLDYSGEVFRFILGETISRSPYAEGRRVYCMGFERDDELDDGSLRVELKTRTSDGSAWWVTEGTGFGKVPLLLSERKAQTLSVDFGSASLLIDPPLCLEGGKWMALLEYARGSSYDDVRTYHETRDAAIASGKDMVSTMAGAFERTAMKVRDWLRDYKPSGTKWKNEGRNG